MADKELCPHDTCGTHTISNHSVIKKGYEANHQYNLKYGYFCQCRGCIAMWFFRHQPKKHQINEGITEWNPT